VKKKAWVNLRSDPHYRKEAFVRGLVRAGYDVYDGMPGKYERGDALVLWNLKAGNEEREARIAKECGAHVFVCENAYTGNEFNGGIWYAIALDGHNGSGRWYVGGADRLHRNPIQMRPWRRKEPPRSVLICGQRGIGSSTMASPARWERSVAAECQLPSEVRPHPGQGMHTISLYAQMERHDAVLIWSSGAGVQALCNGTPVWFAAPHWICQQAARRYDGPDSLRQAPICDDEARYSAFVSLIWAQWSVGEISTGLPFMILTDAFPVH
jgi:hypothetical protein